MEIFIVVVFTCRRMHYVNGYINSSNDPSHDPSQHGFNVNFRILVSTEKKFIFKITKTDGFFFREREKRIRTKGTKCFGSPGTIRSISTTSLLSSLSIDIFDAILCPVVARPVVLFLLISLFLVVNAAFRLFFERKEKRKMDTFKLFEH